MTVAQNPNLWGMAGLIFNMAGAGLLYLAFSGLSRDESRDDSWFEARVGSGLLVAGFFLQATGVSGSHAMDGAAAMLLVMLAASLLFYAAAGRDIVVDALVPQTASSTSAAAAQKMIAADVPVPQRQLEDLRKAYAVG